MSEHKVVKDWTTKAGLRAVILFVGDSHHCGYIPMPSELSKMNFTGYGGEGDFVFIDVHGGVSYQGELGPMDNIFCIGFDCAHYGDRNKYNTDGVFRTVEFCTEQCESMAEQLVALLPKQLGVKQ